VFQDGANLCTERLYGRSHVTQLNPLDNGHLQLEPLGYQRLRVALRGWETSKRDEGGLLRGAPLAEAEGDRLLTGATDGTAIIWDAQSGAELLRYSFGGTVNDSWSPDREQIAFGLSDGTIRIVEVNWHTREELIAHARECCLIRQLTADERELFGLPAR
jgi:WD40 repeat protein